MYVYRHHVCVCIFRHHVCMNVFKYVWMSFTMIHVYMSIIIMYARMFIVVMYVCMSSIIIYVSMSVILYVCMSFVIRKNHDNGCTNSASYLKCFKCSHGTRSCHYTQVNCHGLCCHPFMYVHTYVCISFNIRNYHDSGCTNSVLQESRSFQVNLYSSMAQAWAHLPICSTRAVRASTNNV